MGTTYTPAEKKAGNGVIQLSQDDPLPQTIYRIFGKPDSPLLLLAVPLNYVTPK